MSGASAGGSGARVVVATTLGLWLPGNPPDRLGWAQIHKATWSGSELVITAAAVVATIGEYTVVVDEPPRRHPLPEPGDVPHQVRSRVTRSIAYTVHHTLLGGAGLRIVARRVPGVDGLHWTVRYDSEVDLDNPLVREMTTQLVGQAQAGLEG